MADQPIVIHVHLHTGEAGEVDTTTNQEILATVRDIQLRGNQMAADLAGLTTEVEENATVIGSAVTLLNGFGGQLAQLASELEAAGVDATRVNELRDQLDSQTTALAQAVAKNTPAPEEPAPEPTPEPTPDPTPTPEEPAPTPEEPANP